MTLDFDIMHPKDYHDLDTLEHLIGNKTKKELEEKPFAIIDVFTKCERNKMGQSWLGIALYVMTVCALFVVGYNIYRELDIPQADLSRVEVFGDLCTVGFLSFTAITFTWNNFEEQSCLHKSRSKFRCGLVRYLLFVIGMVSATVIYGTMRHTPLFHKSLNADLSPEQINIYGMVFAVIGAVVIYWFVKLCHFHRKCTKDCCMLKYENKLAFVRLFLFVSAVTIGSYVVCSLDECDYHLHHWFFGYSLVILSTTMMDNCFDFLLHGIFWMFVLESQWNGRPVFDRFFL